MKSIYILARKSIALLLAVSCATSVAATAYSEEEKSEGQPSSVVPKVNLEFDMPLAVGMSKGTMVISGPQFEKFNGYFKAVNAIPKADIPYGVSIEELAGLFDNNEIVLVAMNDSSYVTPEAGVKLLTLDYFLDCVGLFVFQPHVGAAAAHITIGTNLSSLDKALGAYEGQEGVQITVMSSYKTNLLKHVVALLQKKKLPITSLFVNEIVQQMNAAGTAVKRYFDPATLPGIDERVDSLLRRSKKITLGHIKDIMENSKALSPVGAVMRIETGEVNFVAGLNGDNGPHISSGQITNLRQISQSMPCWSAMRYHRSVKPFENDKGVDIAFVQYPVE